MAWETNGTPITLQATSTDIDITNLSGFVFNVTLLMKFSAGDTNANMTWNDVGTTSYTKRTNFDGGSDSTTINQTLLSTGFSGVNDLFLVQYWVFPIGEQNLGIMIGMSRNTAGNIKPRRQESTMKFTNNVTAQRLDYNTTTNLYSIGMNSSVLGTD